MLEEFLSSDVITKILYEEKYRDFKERYNELIDPSIIYVTDLVSCSHKYHLRHVLPELTFAFEPPHVLGDLVHRGLEEILSAKGFKVEYPVETIVSIGEKQYHVKGRIDAYDPDKGIVVEIKTARSSQGTPHYHHIEQIRFYLLFTGAKKGVLIYITPDRIVEYSIDPWEDTGILETRVKETIDDKVHPRWDWECRYCLFNRLCPYRKEQ
ncbi:CRISPR-associated protein Cas4 [Desulfurococcaceae archaeon MEX13E-LK6-19]|nr:CRISPR-associated protein Cas4 [Desulfurococcaceae archaeon MEX13E-LK6-19]